MKTPETATVAVLAACLALKDEGQVKTEEGDDGLAVSLAGDRRGKRDGAPSAYPQTKELIHDREDL